MKVRFKKRGIFKVLSELTAFGFTAFDRFANLPLQATAEIFTDVNQLLHG